MKDHDTVRRVRGAAAAVLILTALAGCTSSSGSTPDPTVPTAPSQSSTTAATPDVSVIPPAIDEPYLNAVLAALDEVDGDATRAIYEAKRLTPEAADLLNAIYSDEALQLEADGWFASLADDLELKGIRPNPGDRRTVVDRVIAASPSCVWLEVRRDYSARNVERSPSRPEYVALQPIDRSNDPRRVNPTPWMITVDGFRADGTEPSGPCPRA